MIYLKCSIRNPWSSRFENVWNIAGSITENKMWEIEILKTENLVRFECQYTIMQDHAGLRLEIGLYGWEFHYSMYDKRHWNYDNKKWEYYGKSS